MSVVQAIPPPIGQSDEERALVLELLTQHGWNTTCFQILNPGIDLWFSRRRDAVVGFVTHHCVRVVAGAPVCSLERLPEVIAEFELECARAGHEVCYFGAEGRIREYTSRHKGYSTAALGAQPFWTPASFVRAFDQDSSLRAQLSRARNKGVTVTEWNADRAHANRELRVCLDEWLQTRGLPPMHFLVEPETLEALDGRRIFVAEQNGLAIGFTVLSPVPQRNGYLTEQFVRGRRAPNGTVELGLYSALKTVLEEGAEYVTMGIVPLSTHGQQASQSNPMWLRSLTSWVRAHGRRFYNFDGLDAFKSKFKPDGWEPIYVISKESRFSFHTLWAITAAFSQCPPTLMISRGITRALKQEIAWARGKRGAATSL